MPPVRRLARNARHYYRFYCYLLLYDLRRTLSARRALPLGARQAVEGARIHTAYFTCAEHADLLILSLESLKDAGAKAPGDVYIFVDRRSPLPADAERRVRGIFPGAIVRPTRWPMSWGGQELVLNELDGFRFIAERSAPADVVVKADADVLFLSRALFEDALRSPLHMIGQRYTGALGLSYAQGGCYAISCELIGAMVSSPIRAALKEAARKTRYGLSSVPEDAVVSSLALVSAGAIGYGDYYLPKENIEKLTVTREDVRRYGIAHCEGRLSGSMEALARLVRAARERAE